MKNICSKYGIQTYFKGNRTFKNPLVATKDKDQMQQRGVIIHWYKGKTEMKNKCENLLEHLIKGLKNIERHLHPYMTITQPQAPNIEQL